MRLSRLAAVLASVVITTTLTPAHAGIPQYDIIDLGIIDPGDIGVQGLGISDGGVAVGRTLGNSNQGFSWTVGGGLNPLPNLAGRPFGAANGANDLGQVVGTGATTFFGSGALPLIWNNGVVSQLPLVAGESVGRANDINAAGIAVGSNDGGSAEFAVYYSGGSATAITATTGGGSFMVTAYGINNSNLIVGNGIDPNNAARNVGLAYDLNTNTMVEVGALPGANGALAFGVSNAGHVVGSSMMNQGSGMPYVWTAGGGMQAIAPPAGATSGSGRDVNSAGWVVGNAGGVFAVPWLYDGTQTYRIQDLIDPGSGWDLSTNTSSSATGISEDGIIVGTGVFNGDTRAYALVPVPTPGALAVFGLGAVFARRRRRH